MFDALTALISKGNIEIAIIGGLVIVLYFIFDYFTKKLKSDKDIVDKIQSQHAIITTKYDDKIKNFEDEISKLQDKVEELKEILREKEKDEFYRNEKLDKVLEDTSENTEEIRDALKDLSHRIDLLIVQIDPTKTIKIDRGLPL